MRSFDRGNTNTTIADFSQAPFNYTAYTTIKLFTPKANADYLLVHVVTDQGATNPNGVFERNHLWRTKNANDPVPTWEELPLPRNAWPATVDFDLDNPDITYIVYSSSSNFTNSVTGTDMIFKMDYTNPAIVSSYNCGPCPPPNNTQLCCSVVCNSGCTDLTQNLANSGIGNDAFAVEEGTNGGLYVGTDFGVYYTNNSYLNNFVGWQKFGTILPNVQCYGMEINYPANKIRVGLYGRGIWEHSLFCPTDQDITLKASIPSDFYEAENNVLITTQFVTVTTNTGDINVRAGNEIDLQIGPNKPGEQIVLNANTRLFIHACDHIGNSFRHQNHTRDNSSLDLAAFTSAKNNEEKKIYEGENGKYTLYPNPFTDHLHIDFLLEKSSDVNISIYNSLGQEIENIANTKYETGSYSLLFDKTNLSSGIYFVKLSIGDKYYTKAVIKK